MKDTGFFNINSIVKKILTKSKKQKIKVFSLAILQDILLIKLFGL